MTSQKSAAMPEMMDRLTRLTAYFSASIDMRNSIAHLEEDERFCREDRGVIRYVFDSNLVRFFLDAAAESDRVNPFSDRGGEAYRKLAIITAEFIFSREMEGQWGAPAMISPAHMEELTVHMQKLTDRLRERERELVDPDESDHDAAERAIRLAQAAKTLGPSVDAFNEMEPVSSAEGVNDLMRELRQAEMLDRVRRHDLLEPLYLDENATDEVVSPSPDRLKDWERRVQKQHQSSTIERTRKGSRSKQLDKSDAETAEQIVQLNRVAAEAGLRPTRYLLITLDRNLFNAAVDWWEDGGQNELEFFPFRRLSQYVPVLNTGLMPNKIARDDVRDRFNAALDTLLGIGSRRREKFPLYIPEPAIRPPSDSLAEELFIPLQWISQRWRGAHEVQETTVKLWRELVRRANYVNAELLRRREAAYENFAEFFANSPNTRNAAVGFLRRAIERVESIHIELNLAHNLASEILKRPEGQVEMIAVRGMPVIREQFEKVLDGEPLYPLLDRVVIDQDIDLLKPISHQLREAPRWQAVFFAGCVAFWSGQWDSAVVYARRAASSVEPSVGGSELAYFRVMTGRFAAMDIPSNTTLSDMQGMKRVLIELKRLEPHVEAMMTSVAVDDAFARYRSRVEKALWLISMSFVSYFIGEKEVGSATKLVEDALDQLRDCGTEEDTPFDGSIAHDALMTLRIERLIAEAACLIHLFCFGQTQSNIPRNAQLAEEIAVLVEENPTVAPSFYKIVVPLLRIAASGDAGDLIQTTNHATDAIDTILRGDHHMTWLDRVSLEQMRAFLREGRWTS